MSDRDYEAIAERLAAIEEELRDLAYERLRAAAATQTAMPAKPPNARNAG